MGTLPGNPDTDGDGLSDGEEVLKYGTNPLNPDTDGDMLSDYEEVKVYFTNPHLFDTDYDGIADGYELQNLSMLGISRGDWSAILHAWDYDEDGIPDGYEIKMAYWASKYDTGAYENGSYLNVTNSTDAYADFDADGLTNLEEYQRDPAGDFDRDGTPDIYDDMDDNDGIPTAVELQNHLDPFNPRDAAGDLDHDGLSNLFEFKNGLNIQDADTDHDGIADGAELNYWNTTRGLPMEVAINYTRKPDVDRDNITDGKEINGYEVKIITGWDGDGKPLSRSIEIKNTTLDPLIPYGYNDSSGNFHWSDVDSDGIPDVVEAMLSNASYFWAFYNFTHRDDWLRAEREKLWDDYNWSIAYYLSLKLNRSYDVILTNIKNDPNVYIPHYIRADAHNESCGENATKYLTSQFNPMIVENMPPVVVKFNVNFTYYLLTAKMQVYAVVRDAGTIKKIELIDSDFGQSHTWYPHGKSATINYTFWASPWGANLGANITLIVEDMRGNNASMSQVVYGPEGVLIKMFLDWLASFLQVLAQVGKEIAGAINSLAKYLIDLFENLIVYPLQALENLMQGYLNNAVAVLEEYADKIANGTATPGDLVEFSIKMNFNVLMAAGLALGIALEIAFMAVTAATMCVAGIILSAVLPMATYLIVMGLIHQFAPNNTVNMISEVAGNWVNLGIDKIIDTVMWLLHWLNAPVNYSQVGHILSAFSFLISAPGNIISIINGVLVGTDANIIAAVFALISLVYGSISLYLTKYSQSHSVSRAAILITSLYSIASGIGGAIFGLYTSLLKSPNLVSRIVGAIVFIISIVSISLSVVSLFKGGI